MKAIPIIDKKTVELVLKRERENVRKITDEEISDSLLNKQSDIDAVTLTAVRQAFGAGQKRLMHFIRVYKMVYDYYNNRYDDADIYVMKRDLLAIGIDVDKIPEMYKEMEGAMDSMS